MRPAASLLTRLDVETRSYHADADAPWLELVTGEASATQYMQQLVRTYGFEAPLEAALAYTPQLGSLIDLRRRSRSGFIAQDLLSLQLGPDQIATIPQCLIAPFANATEALGWMYVSERATLGHDALREQLVRRNPALGKAVAYLGASKGLAQSRLDELGEVLDMHARCSNLQDQIIDAAHDAFRCSLDWVYGKQKLQARA